MKHVDGVFGRPAAGNDGYQFFAFTKANLTREHLKTLARGGLREMIPGAESLNTHVLELMCKGTTKLQNVNMMRWATYYGVRAGFFLIHGFPGERLEDYADERETLLLIGHLSPPNGHYRITYERFSPFFCDTERFPIKWRRPAAVYDYVYPAHVNREDVAYFFDYEFAGDVLPEEAHYETREILKRLVAAFESPERPMLTYRRRGSDLLIVDTRFNRDRPGSYTLQGSDADAYEVFSAAPQTPAQVCATLATNNPGLLPDEESVAATCAGLCDAGLMIGDGGKYLSLALPAEPNL
jgi:hypothetical protein